MTHVDDWPGPLALTADRVATEVDAIRAASDDDETAHWAEDDLWSHVLEAIAQGNPHPVALARAALRTCDLNFHRWYA